MTQQSDPNRTVYVRTQTTTRPDRDAPKTTVVQRTGTSTSR